MKCASLYCWWSIDVVEFICATHNRSHWQRSHNPILSDLIIAVGPENPSALHGCYQEVRLVIRMHMHLANLQLFSPAVAQQHFIVIFLCVQCDVLSVQSASALLHNVGHPCYMGEALCLRHAKFMWFSLFFYFFKAMCTFYKVRYPYVTRGCCWHPYREALMFCGWQIFKRHDYSKNLPSSKTSLPGGACKPLQLSYLIALLQDNARLRNMPSLGTFSETCTMQTQPV